MLTRSIRLRIYHLIMSKELLYGFSDIANLPLRCHHQQEPSNSLKFTNIGYIFKSGHFTDKDNKNTNLTIGSLQYIKINYNGYNYKYISFLRVLG